MSSLATDGTCHRRLLNFDELTSFANSFLGGHPACRLGDFGSFVSPSYSIVSKHTGNTFFVKVLWTNSNV